MRIHPAAIPPSSPASSVTRSKPRRRPTSMSTSSWTTMGPTKRHSSGGGLRSDHASMSTTRPPTGPGSTWSSGGLPNSPTNKSAAGFTAVSANWRPPSANSSPPTTKPPTLSFGPKPPTKSSPTSPATRNAVSPPNPGNLSHEPLGQEPSNSQQTKTNVRHAPEKGNEQHMKRIAKIALSLAGAHTSIQLLAETKTTKRLARDRLHPDRGHRAELPHDLISGVVFRPHEQITFLARSLKRCQQARLMRPSRCETVGGRDSQGLPDLHRGGKKAKTRLDGIF